MNDGTPHRRPGRRPGLARRFLAALLTGADETLAHARAEAEEQAAEDDQCRLRPDHSRLTRGHREL